MNTLPFKKLDLVKSYFRNETGVTLVELLVSMSIFLLVVLPLSSYYLSGINQYNKITLQTALRNEADYVISQVMNQVQDASYFELTKTPGSGTQEEQDRNHLISILKNHLPSESIIDSCQLGIITKNIEVKSESKITRQIYRFSDPPAGKENLIKQFDYNQSLYLINGLFSISDDYQKVTIFLVVAPKSKGFNNLGDINNSDSSNREYIRVVKTEISVNALRKG